MKLRGISKLKLMSELDTRDIADELQGVLSQYDELVERVYELSRQAVAEQMEPLDTPGPVNFKLKWRINALGEHLIDLEIYARGIEDMLHRRKSK